MPSGLMTAFGATGRDVTHAGRTNLALPDVVAGSFFDGGSVCRPCVEVVAAFGELVLELEHAEADAVANTASETAVTTARECDRPANITMLFLSQNEIVGIGRTRL